MAGLSSIQLSNPAIRVERTEFGPFLFNLPSALLSVPVSLGAQGILFLLSQTLLLVPFCLVTFELFVSRRNSNVVLLHPRVFHPLSGPLNCEWGGSLMSGDHRLSQEVPLGDFKIGADRQSRIIGDSRHFKW